MSTCRRYEWTDESERAPATAWRGALARNRASFKHSSTEGEGVFPPRTYGWKLLLALLAPAPATRQRVQRARPEKSGDGWPCLARTAPRRHQCPQRLSPAGRRHRHQHVDDDAR